VTIPTLIPIRIQRRQFVREGASILDNFSLRSSNGSADLASRPLCVRPVSHARLGKPGMIEEEVTGVREGAALHRWQKGWNSMLETDQTPRQIVPRPPAVDGMAAG
jgi:hypothetical protein